MSVLRVLFAVFVWAAPGLASAEPVSLSAALESKPRDLWRAVMTRVYGPYNSAKKCWVGKKGADAYCMRPHKFDKVSAGARSLLYFAVAGAAVDGQDCHDCQGSLGLLVFEKRGSDYVLASQNGLFDEIGSWGEVPTHEGFKIVQVAPGTHAWSIETGYTAQGVTASGFEIFAPKGASVLGLGYIPTYLDNCGAKLDGEACKSYEFDISFQPGKSSFYDARVTKSAKSSALPGASAFDILFDAASGKYAVPQELEDLLEM